MCILWQNAIGHITEWPCLVGKKMHYDRKCHDHVILKNKADKNKADLIPDNQHWPGESGAIPTFWFIILLIPKTGPVITEIIYSLSKDRKLNDLLFLSYDFYKEVYLHLYFILSFESVARK